MTGISTTLAYYGLRAHKFSPCFFHGEVLLGPLSPTTQSRTSVCCFGQTSLDRENVLWQDECEGAACCMILASLRLDVFEE